jgi:hypothetical protein
MHVWRPYLQPRFIRVTRLEIGEAGLGLCLEYQRACHDLFRLLSMTGVAGRRSSTLLISRLQIKMYLIFGVLSLSHSSKLT